MRPTKATDSRSRGFTGGSVEVDAIAPSVLRALVQTAIQSRVDVDQLARTLAAETRDRRTLTEWVDHRDINNDVDEDDEETE